MRRLVGAVVVALVIALGAPVASAETGSYAPPVDGPVVDGWRPPADPYGPGNRGIDYATAPGEPVRAAASGTVVFAGRVGAGRHVVVLHPDGVRTSYSFLATVAVRRGDAVERGDPVGTAATSVHFGARVADRYVDPNLLLDGVAPDVHLVPVGDPLSVPEAEERSGLLASLVGLGGGAVRAGAAGVAWARDTVAGAATLLEAAGLVGWDALRAELDELALALEVLGHYALLPLAVAEQRRRGAWFRADQQGCTPASVPAPPSPGRRRIAVLVAGLGSSGGGGAVLDVNTAALGYGGGEVAQFSYNGGQAPGPRQLDGIAVTDYDAGDSTADIRAAAAHLRRLLQAIRSRHPGTPVDLIAHSQGGIVVRTALGAPGDAVDPRLPVIANVVTLGSPHHGADLATAGVAVGIDSVAVGQLAETSDLMDELARRPLPTGTRVTSIAAGGDLVVPALQSGLRDAVNVVVPVHGVSAHDRLPGSAEAHRELALALAGRAPTCRSVDGDLRLALGISVGEDLLGLGVGLAARWLDVRLPVRSLPAVELPALRRPPRATTTREDLQAHQRSP